MGFNRVICIDISEKLNLFELFLVGVPLGVDTADKLALYMHVFPFLLSVCQQTWVFAKSLIRFFDKRFKCAEICINLSFRLSDHIVCFRTIKVFRYIWIDLQSIAVNFKLYCLCQSGSNLLTVALFWLTAALSFLNSFCISFFGWSFHALIPAWATARRHRWHTTDV